MKINDVTGNSAFVLPRLDELFPEFLIQQQQHHQLVGPILSYHQSLIRYNI